MSVILQKGSGYNASFASADFPTLSADWTGEVSLYVTYPGTATFSKAMTRSGNVMLLPLTAGEILALNAGPYYFVSTITNAVLGVTITSVDMASVLNIHASTATMCKISGTILKNDNTPAGKETRLLENTVGGVVATLGWKGVEVRLALAVADTISGDVVGIEDQVTTTDAIGYFELYVIQGLTVTITCPSFGKSVTVITTALTDIDISTYF